MTRSEIRAFAGTLGGAAALIALILGAQGLLDRIERDTDDRLQYRQWVADACTPRPGQTTIATIDAGKLRCTTYSRIGYGLAPQVVSAAVMEPPL